MTKTYRGKQQIIQDRDYHPIDTWNGFTSPGRLTLLLKPKGAMRISQRKNGELTLRIIPHTLLRMCLPFTVKDNLHALGHVRRRPLLLPDLQCSQLTIVTNLNFRQRGGPHLLARIKQLSLKSVIISV